MSSPGHHEGRNHAAFAISGVTTALRFHALRLAGRTIAAMPTAIARYDVTLSDGFADWRSYRPETSAVLDMAEERIPDDWGDPGRLVDACLARVLWTSQGRREDIGYQRPHLTLRGARIKARMRHRRFLRWALPDDDPPPHDDPDWILPP